MNLFVNKLNRITTQDNNTMLMGHQVRWKVKPSLRDAQNNKNITQKTQL